MHSPQANRNDEAKTPASSGESPEAGKPVAESSSETKQLKNSLQNRKGSTDTKVSKSARPRKKGGVDNSLKQDILVAAGHTTAGIILLLTAMAEDSVEIGLVYRILLALLAATYVYYYIRRTIDK